jgi:hypothetical protein
MMIGVSIFCAVLIPSLYFWWPGVVRLGIKVLQYKIHIFLASIQFQDVQVDICCGVLYALKLLP